MDSSRQQSSFKTDRWQALATSAAWKKITAGPEYEIKTARNPAVIAETDQSFLNIPLP
jgi:hypothetical protein